MSEPKVTFDFNQMVYVYTNDPEISYIPCIPYDDGCITTRIPNKSWIKYRGLARFLGDIYMRFIYDDEQVYVSPALLSYLEDIPQRKPGDKVRAAPKSLNTAKRKRKGVRKFVASKTNTTLGKPFKGKKKRKRRRKI